MIEHLVKIHLELFNDPTSHNIFEHNKQIKRLNKEDVIKYYTLLYRNLYES